MRKKLIFRLQAFISGNGITPIFERKTFRNNQHDWFGQWADWKINKVKNSKATEK